MKSWTFSIVEVTVSQLLSAVLFLIPPGPGT